MTSYSTSLTARLAAWPASPGAARPVHGWAGNLLLWRYATAGEAAVAARTDPVLFEVLAGRSGEEVAVLAAVSVVASHLVPVAGRWARSGMPAEVFADMDADLVAETVALVAGAGGRPAERLARVAWQRVSGRRRTDRARTDRQVPLADWHVPVVAGHAGRVCLTASDRLVALAAVSGWGPVEASARLGITPVAWRARSSRLRRGLRAGVGVV